MTELLPDKRRAEPPVAAGDPADVAIPRLIAAHGDMLYTLGVRMCGNRTDAEDLVQEIFLQAYRRWDQFEGRSKPSSWLYTIASRACRRMHRRRAGEPARIQSLEELLPFDVARTPQVDPAAAEHDEEVRAAAQTRVQAAMATLPPTFRLPLVLKDIAGFSIAEVAEILGIKPATVKTRVHRARLRVRRELEQALPTTGEELTGPAYAKGLCLDLLRAKQESIDRGAPFHDEVLCERCRSVFATLDLTHDLCGELGRGTMPAELARRLRDIGTG